MDHMQLSDELRNQLLEAAAWGKAGITPTLRIDESGEEEEEEFEEAEEVFEEAHACPLCASQLDESIDEERLLEHLNVIMGLVDRLSQLNEGDEDIDTVIDETLAELLLQQDEE
jgi:DNA repair exonuclease SbcCD ATPase subunit